MFIYIYMYVCMYIYVYIYICMYIYVCMYVCMYVCIRMYMCVFAHMSIPSPTTGWTTMVNPVLIHIDPLCNMVNPVVMC